MRAPRNWKQIQRHSLSAEYPNIAGRAWELFVANLQEHGIVDGRKVVLYEGKIVDGWQLYRGCVDADIKPQFRQLKLPDGMSLEQWVETANDHRRHETPEHAAQRIAERRERVTAARRQGESLRKIADSENVSEATVRTDLANATAQGCAVDPPNGKVTGLDDKQRPATQPTIIPALDALIKAGNISLKLRPSIEALGRDQQVLVLELVQSGTNPREAVRKATAPVDGTKSADDPPPVTESIPERLVPFFALAAKCKEARRLAVRLGNLMEEIEQAPVYSAMKGKSTKLHSTYARNTADFLESITPQRPCPECGGTYEPSMDNDPCTVCRDRGYQTVSEVKK